MPYYNKKVSNQIAWFDTYSQSGWRDLNPRLLRPERSALPGCATPRSLGIIPEHGAGVKESGLTEHGIMHTGHTANFDGTICREKSYRMTDTQTHIHVQRKARSPKTSSTSNGNTRYAGTRTLQSKSTFERYSFPNGMTLIAKEVHSAPVVSFWVWY